MSDNQGETGPEAMEAARAFLYAEAKTNAEVEADPPKNPLTGKQRKPFVPDEWVVKRLAATLDTFRARPVPGGEGEVELRQAALELADSAEATVAECGLNRTIEALDSAVRYFRSKQARAALRREPGAGVCERCGGSGELGPRDDKYVCPYCAQGSEPTKEATEAALIVAAGFYPHDDESQGRLARRIAITLDRFRAPLVGEAERAVVEAAKALLALVVVVDDCDPVHPCPDAHFKDRGNDRETRRQAGIERWNAVETLRKALAAARGGNTE